MRSGASNKSDLGGVLQTNNIHIAVCPPGEVTKTLVALKASPATAKAKAKFVLATDGETLEAEDLQSGETVACAYQNFPDRFGFFLTLAGITTVKPVRENSFDIKATGRLNRLYRTLLEENPDWEQSTNTALIDGVRKFAMDVRELDIDLIDKINPFSGAYAILAKAMNEDRLKQVQAAIAAKRTSLTPEEAKDLAVRAVKFKKERGRLPSISSTDGWEKRMAEGAAAFVRFKDEGRYD